MKSPQPPPHPFHTKAQLRHALATCFNSDPTADLDVDGVAGELGVHPGTVRRWLRGHGRGRAPIGTKALRQLQFGPAADDRRELQKVAYALQALERIDSGRKRDVDPRWHEQGWTAQYHVVIAELFHRDLRQVVYTSGGTRARDLEIPGRVVDTLAVPSRFDAIILVGQLLEHLRPWRLYPSERCVPISRTRCWSNRAPIVTLRDRTLFPDVDAQQ